MSEQLIIPTAEPFFYPGNETGCLLIHGFTGTPKEMHPMGKYLAERGHTVLGVRLAGHATQMEDMVRMRYWDWIASVEDGWHMLQGSTKRVFVIGLSMGGVLSLLFASRYPVAGAVAMSTPSEVPVAGIQRLLVSVSPLLSLALPFLGKHDGKWFNPEVGEDHVSYPGHPVRSVYELDKLTKLMRAGLPGLTAPVLLMHSRDDVDVPYENANTLYEEIGGADKEVLLVEGCNHVITRDGDTSRVFKAADDFIRRVNAGG
jgi:carboxylesterase